MFHNTKRKQIILVRHGKTLDFSEFNGMDFDLPLSERGKNSLSIVAKYLRLIGVKPDKLISSPSRRTLQTAEILWAQYPWIKVEYVKDLYNAGSAGKRDSDAIYLWVIQKIKKDATILVIVGHNDDLTNFAKFLTGDGVPSLKKWSIAVLSVPDNTEWKDIKKNTLSFVYYLTAQFLRLEELA
jgi:phosphohistidine phosphatase